MRAIPIDQYLADADDDYLTERERRLLHSYDPPARGTGSDDPALREQRVSCRVCGKVTRSKQGLCADHRERSRFGRSSRRTNKDDAETDGIPTQP